MFTEVNNRPNGEKMTNLVTLQERQHIVILPMSSAKTG
jgi:hypothetical protein